MTRRISTVLAAPVVALVALLAVPAGLWAQDAGVAIEPARTPLTDRDVLDQAMKLQEAGKLLDAEKIQAGLRSPRPARLDLPAPSTRPLTARQLAERGRAALVRIGWFYKCTKCTRWHLNLAGGYAITADGAVATCHHVVSAKNIAMREGYLIALDADNKVLPVTGVLAGDPIMDAAIVRVAGGEKLTPLALNDRVAPGDPVYLYSDPMRVAGYFSTGMVNRFFWRLPVRNGDPTRLSGARAYRLHVSTDWAPGSSGAAVLDACGNAVGHVAVISSMQQKPSTPTPAPAPSTQKGAKGGDSDGDARDGKDDDDHGAAPIAPPSSGAGPTMMVLHEAVPARGVRLLAQSATAPAAAKEEPKGKAGEKDE